MDLIEVAVVMSVVQCWQIRRNDWSIACEAQHNWSSPDQFASQLQIMLKQIGWMEDHAQFEDDFLHSKCRNPSNLNNY